MPAGHVPQPVLLKKLADTKCLSLHAIRYAEYASPHMPRIRSLRHACSIRVDIFYPRNKNFHIQCIQRTRVTSRYQRNRRALERKEILCRSFSTRSRIHSRNHGKKRREKLKKGQNISSATGYTFQRLLSSQWLQHLRLSSRSNERQTDKRLVV